MPLGFTITLPTFDSIAAELNATPRNVALAARRSTNRTLTTGQTRLASIVKAKTPLKARFTKARLKIIKATLTDLRGVIQVGSKRIELIEFNAKQTRRGVNFTYFKGNRQLLRSAFIVETGTRGEQVLRRKTDASRPSGLVGRDPVFMRFGLPLTAIVNRLQPNIETDLGEIFARRFRKDLDFFEGKTRRPAIRG